MAPGTEAPAGMHFYFPRFRALCMAENATHNLHNLLTLRGALVRDPHAWSGYLTEAIDTFADRADVVFASHHWPTWGRDSIVEFLSLQRDMYAYLHDQTLRLLNRGSPALRSPRCSRCRPRWNGLGTRTAITGRSATTSRPLPGYMGWFDGNPARLWPHPPEAPLPVTSTLWAGLTGSSSSRKQRSTPANSVGLQRFSITRSSPTPSTARPAGCTRPRWSNSPTVPKTRWRRNFFMSGATELRDGNFGTAVTAASISMLNQLTPEQIFDSLALRVDGPRSWELDIALDITFVDSATNYRLALRNGVLIYRKVAADSATATVTAQVDEQVPATDGGDG